MRVGKDVIINEKDKRISKILHRMVSEECTKLTSVAGKISTLNFQAENFHQMREDTQSDVIKDMEKLMLENGWDNWVRELKRDAILGADE